MKSKRVVLMLALCVLLGGCSGWMNGSYSSVSPHLVRDPQGNDQSLAVSGYEELRDALVDMVADGAESALINVAQMDQDHVIRDVEQAIGYVTDIDPIGAFAVSSIKYEQGTSGGQSALAVTVTYNHNRSEIGKIKQAEDMEAACQIISSGLQECQSRVVMRVRHYQDTDLVQFVADYADEAPDLIMELPLVTVNMYPESGEDRVLEIVFTYQSSRESLRSMQSRVRPLFTSAELYVTGINSDQEKYTLLYAFLMERNQYTVETSITPTYSLLIHGVGDSKAFAVVYSAMCRRAGLECMVISGTWKGEPLFWNLICQDGIYYHVDLLRCNREGGFHQWTDRDMEGYVWDYSAYPESVAPEPDPTDPTEQTDAAETTDPTETQSTETEPPTEPEKTEE